MADSFVEAKFLRPYQITTDARLPALAARVAIVLTTQYFNKCVAITSDPVETSSAVGVNPPHE